MGTRGGRFRGGVGVHELCRGFSVHNGQKRSGRANGQDVFQHVLFGIQNTLCAIFFLEISLVYDCLVLNQS